MDYVSDKDIQYVAPVVNTENSNNNGDNTTNATGITDPAPNTANDNTIGIKAGNVNIGINENGSIKIGTKEGGINVNTKDKSGNIGIDDGKNGITLNKAAKTGCASPMNYTRFDTIKKTVSTQSTDADRSITANTFLENNCFTTAQIKEIMLLSTLDKSKLEFAKNAYSHTNDLGNYYQLKSILKEEADKKDLQTFINNRK